MPICGWSELSFPRRRESNLIPRYHLKEKLDARFRGHDKKSYAKVSKPGATPIS
jgi:hypothetical protein